MAADSTNSQDPKRRVVVTGLGVVSGCGIGHETFFQSLLDGKSSIDRVKRFDISAYPCQIGSEVPEDMFNPADFFVNPKNIKSNDRFTHFAVAAARQALKDGNMGDTPETLINPDRIGVMVGTAFGGMETFERETIKLAAKPDRPKVSVIASHGRGLVNRQLSPVAVVVASPLVLTSPRRHRYHPLLSQLSSQTLRPELLALNADAADPTMASSRPAPPEAMRLAKPWE